MPLPNTFTPFTNSSTVTASSVNSRVQDVEQFINGDIEQSDLPITPWVDSSIIVGPEFYGSPAPRVQLVSSDVHYRRETGGTEALFFHHELSTEFIPVPGLNATVHVSIPDGYPQSYVEAHIRASFFAENTNSVLGSTLPANAHLLVTYTAEFALFNDETRIKGTLRRVYTETSAEADIAGQNVSMVGKVQLSRGIHNLGVRIKPIDPGSIADWQHTVIRHRTLNIEIHYL